MSRIVFVAVFSVGLVALLQTPNFILNHFEERAERASRRVRVFVPEEIREDLKIYGAGGHPVEHIADGEYTLTIDLMNEWAYTHLKSEKLEMSVQFWTRPEGETRIVVNSLPDGYKIAVTPGEVIRVTAP